MTIKLNIIIVLSIKQEVPSLNKVGVFNLEWACSTPINYCQGLLTRQLKVKLYPGIKYIILDMLNKTTQIANEIYF